MSATDHTKQYSAADIQRYLEGKLLPAEMHELEKAALEDPFLADAIEGMQQTLEQHGSAVVQAHLQDIRQQVADRTRKEAPTKMVAPVRSFRWWQVAAAAVVVLTGTIWAIRYFEQTAGAPEAQQLAVVENKADKDALANTDSVAQATTPAEKPAVGSGVASPAEQPQSNPRIKKQPASAPVAVHRTLPVKDIQATSPAALQAAADEQQSNAFARGADTASDQALAANQPHKAPDNANARKAFFNSLDKTYTTKPSEYEQIVVASKKKDTTAHSLFKPAELAMNRSRKELSARQVKDNPDALLSGFISGRVTDQANNPVSNALVRVEDDRVFYTDRQGQFKIPVKDTTSVLNVAVASKGYYTQTVQLTNYNQGNLTITLNQLGAKAPNPQLNEALQAQARGIIAIAAEADSTANRNHYSNIIAAQDAQPEFGWPAYQQYLEKNKQVPPGTPQLTGTVVVSFLVNRKGVTSDFKVEQSLDKAYDDEALRLVKAGPSWKVNKGRKAKVTVLIRF